MFGWVSQYNVQYNGIKITPEDSFDIPVPNLFDRLTPSLPVFSLIEKWYMAPQRAQKTLILMEKSRQSNIIHRFTIGLNLLLNYSNLIDNNGNLNLTWPTESTCSFWNPHMKLDIPPDSQQYCWLWSLCWICSLCLWVSHIQ